MPAIIRCVIWKLFVFVIIAMIMLSAGQSFQEAGAVAVVHAVLMVVLEGVHNSAWEKATARNLA